LDEVPRKLGKWDRAVDDWGPVEAMWTKGRVSPAGISRWQQFETPQSRRHWDVGLKNAKFQLEIGKDSRGDIFLA